MAYQDVEVSDIVIVADEPAADKIDDLAVTLKSIGVEIETVDHDNGVIEGTVEAIRVKIIKETPGVKFVRVVFTYVADYPMGDPRNQDSDDRPDEQIPR
jgi:hypothetical protein